MNDGVAKRWEDAKFFSKILGKGPKETFYNMALINKYRDYLVAPNVHKDAHVKKILEEGKWGRKEIHNIKLIKTLSEILHKPESECEERLDIFKPYVRQIKYRIPFYIAKALKEGWNEDMIIGEESSSKEVSLKEEKIKDSFDSLKLMKWTVDKIGSMKEAKRIFLILEEIMNEQ